MRCAVYLPYRLQLQLGRLIGRLMSILIPYRREVAQQNLRLCFPQLDKAQQERLLRRHFESVGMGLMETAMCWWMPEERLAPLAHLEGLGYLENALKQGRGVLLLSAHFTSLELGCRLLALYQPLHITYREARNPLFNTIMKRARSRHAQAVIHRHDVRRMLKALKGNAVVWYAPDQDNGRQNAVFAPFFGIPAATIIATSRLAKISGAPVLPFFTRRRSDGQGYIVNILPPIQDFPSADAAADVHRINALIEAEVGKAPEQYLWIHRRFKTRPDGEPELYRQKPSRLRRQKKALTR